MGPDELAERIESLIIASNEVYAKAIKRVQNELYDNLVLRLKNLELQDGYIKQNSYNRKILREAQAEFDLTISISSYQSSLEKHLSVIPKINELNSLYFQTIQSAFTANKNFIKSLQSQTIKNVKSLILQDGLRAQIQIPLNQLLEQNVSSGGSFNGMLKQLGDFVKGNEEIEGRLLKYTKTYLSDILFQYARSFQESVTSDLGLEWYRYSGGLVDRSREFCTERNGHFFHRSEIESWASLSWKGKDPLTTKSSIFIVLGGFNCRHELIPVSTSIVPEEDLSRI